MIDFAGPRPNATVVCLQIVAIRMEGGSKLHHIVEHLVYDEGNGEVRPLSRDAVVSYIVRLGRGSVISRDSISKKVEVEVYEHEGQRWLRTAPDGEFEDNLYALYHYERPQLDAQTWHVASGHHSRERTLAGVFDLIVRSDRNGEAGLIGRAELAALVAAAPGRYLVDTPRIPNRMLLAGQAGGKPIVSVSGPEINGANAIFSLPQHSFNLIQLM